LSARRQLRWAPCQHAALGFARRLVSQGQHKEKLKYPMCKY
jgi:hypothetical protein